MRNSSGSTCRRNETVIFPELKAGLRETSRYLLSHHEESELYRCYALRIGNKTVHLCSRCVGIYAGIVLGLFLHAQTLFSSRAYLPAIAVLPLFALIDWSFSVFAGWRGHNVLRTLSGLLLGIAYALGLMLFFATFPNPGVISIGIFYGIVAGALFFLRTFKGSPTKRYA